MELIDAIQKRYSVRSYKNLPVEDEKLDKVLDAARLAPSAVNFQPWYFIVVREEKQRQKLNEVYARKWFTSAPVVIIACVDHSKVWVRASDGKNSADIDPAIAIDHLTLRATDLGLGTCWVCNFDAKKCRELFSLPENIEPIALIPIGYPDDQPNEKKRKKLDEVVFWDGFGKVK